MVSPGSCEPDGTWLGWTHDPFAATVLGDTLFGRGATDMKGGVAALVAAASIPRDRGTLSLLITGDEEGSAIDGTTRVLEWMVENKHLPDMCLVGEPTSRESLGDTVKIGRRGSMNATMKILGTQGHSAYPQLADNPVHHLVRILKRLILSPLDAGTEWFEPSTLQVTSVDVGNIATNIIPAEAQARLNIRFNDLHSAASLEAMLHDALKAEASRYELMVECSGEAFLTRPGPFVEAISRAVLRMTGRTPVLDTGGGTSDARFISKYCPVAELGLIGATMHQVDERISVSELRALVGLYSAVIEECLR